MLFTVFNVNFGDCFLLQDADDKLLVDYGSTSKAQDLQPVMGKVQHQMCCAPGRKAALLSHYHADHYKFFHTLGKNVFDAFYLPYVYCDRRANGGRGACILAKSAIVEYLTHPYDGEAHFFLSDQMEQILDTVKAGGVIKPLKCHDYFNIGHEVCEVLWPESPASGDSSFLQKVALKIVQSYESIIYGGRGERNQDEVSWDGLSADERAAAGQLESNICEYYWLLTEGNREGFDGGTGWRARIGELHTAQERLLQGLLPVALRLQRQVPRGVKRGIKVRFNDYNNALSIVFQIAEKSSCFRYKLLMTGDITKKVMNHLIEMRDVRGPYCCVKCPHHGTRPYYTDKFPGAALRVISTSPAFKPVKPVAKEYCTRRYPDCLTICTNGYPDCCEALAKGRVKGGYLAFGENVIRPLEPRWVRSLSRRSLERLPGRICGVHDSITIDLG